MDIGAFHGWYAALLAPKASAGATFVLVEPDPEAQPSLFRNVAVLSRLFPHISYVIVTKAAGDGSCVRFTYPDGPNGHPRFASFEGEDQERSLTLDQLVDGLGVRPSLLKIDVEGAEEYVMRGANRVITEHNPVVMLETHPQWQPEGIQADQVAEPLRAAGYQSVVLNASDLSVRELWSRPSLTPSP